MQRWMLAGLLALTACAGETVALDPDGGAAAPDAMVDAAGPDAAVTFELVGCSSTSGDVVTMIEGEFGGIGVGSTDVYLGRNEEYGISDRGKLYEAPKIGGVAVQLIQDRWRSSAPRDIRTDGHRLYFTQSSSWAAIEFDGTLSDFLGPFNPQELELDNGMVYVTVPFDGLWRRPSDASAPWELVTPGRFRGPLDVAGGFALTGGLNPDGFDDFEYVFRIDLSDDSIATWAWGRDQIHALVGDGGGVYWVEGLSKDNYRLSSPLIFPSRLLEAGYGGISTCRLRLRISTTRSCRKGSVT